MPAFVIRPYAVNSALHDTMTTHLSRKTIFYSWQSDLPPTSNLQLIRAQLRGAMSVVEEQHIGLSINLDEATRDLPGSPHIPTAITEKIKASDYFVCDVSTINSDDPNARKCPNPNVVFELGYAVATLGWGRIVMLVNKEYGEMSDLPFDFDRHRASAYKAGETPSNSDKGELKALLTASISAMLKADPEKPGAEISPEQKKRLRDVANLKEVLSTIHIPTIDEHVASAPRMLLDRTLHFWESFNGVITSNRFHLYDETLHRLLIEFHESFRETVAHDECYHPNHGNNAYIFTNPGDLPLTGSREQAWAAMSRAVKEMSRLFVDLLSRIREDYIEIDLEETSRLAWRMYRSHQQEMLDQQDS